MQASLCINATDGNGVRVQVMPWELKRPCCYYYERLVFGVVSTMLRKFRERFSELLTIAIVNNYCNDFYFLGILFKLVRDKSKDVEEIFI